LVFLRDGEPVALLPGGLVGWNGKTQFCSPVGASVGGFAVKSLRAELALQLVDALQTYAREQSWGGVQITLPPRYFSFESAELVSFALFCKGFRLEHSWLCPVLPLAPEKNRFEQLYRSRQGSFVRAARRKGMRAVVTGVEGWDNFVLPFRDTYKRHGVAATHAEEEIRDLLIRMPDRVKIHVALLNHIPAASFLMLALTKDVASSFYICSSNELSNEHGAAFLFAEAIDHLASEGFRYLDLGPSASDMKFNAGVTFFKEGLGAIGHCRELWQWTAGP
jgi:hypothetical protein